MGVRGTDFLIKHVTSTKKDSLIFLETHGLLDLSLSFPREDDMGSYPQ